MTGPHRPAPKPRGTHRLTEAGEFEHLAVLVQHGQIEASRHLGVHRLLHVCARPTTRASGLRNTRTYERVMLRVVLVGGARTLGRKVHSLATSRLLPLHALGMQLQRPLALRGDTAPSVQSSTPSLHPHAHAHRWCGSIARWLGRGVCEVLWDVWE